MRENLQKNRRLTEITRKQGQSYILQKAIGNNFGRFCKTKFVIKIIMPNFTRLSEKGQDKDSPSKESEVDINETLITWK